MKTIHPILLLAILLYTGSYAYATPPKTSTTDKQRHAFVSLPVKYQTLLTTWLSQDCRVDSGMIEADMSAAGSVLEDALWEAYKLGPTEEARADLQHSLGERYALRLRWLKQNGPEAVKSSFYSQLLAETEEQFRAKEMAKLIARWRDTSVTGLGLVCTDRSLERMRLLAKDKQNPSSLAANEALKRSGNCAPLELRTKSVR